MKYAVLEWQEGNYTKPDVIAKNQDLKNAELLIMSTPNTLHREYVPMSKLNKRLQIGEGFDYQDYYAKHEGQYAVYKTDNVWIDKNERLVKIKKAHKRFVEMAVMDHDGNELYTECCNYFSLDDGGDSLQLL